MSTRRFAVCVDGARDNYEAAIALAEVGCLEVLLTDVYLGYPLLRALAPLVKEASVPRYRQDLPASLVRSSLTSMLAQRLPMAAQVLGSAQDVLSRRFAAIARRSPTTGLFAYAGFARRAFDPRDESRRKILFQYHPQRIYEREALHAAGVEAPDVSDDPDDVANIQELNAADGIVCASSFTRRSIERVLEAPKPIIVAPYGSNISLPPETVLQERKRLKSRRAKGGVRMLFVGSGVPRKGIGRLLAAWHAVALPEDRLTLIVRGVDARIAPLLAQAGDTVVVRSHLSRPDLFAEFLSADIFVFPSLSEGFAHVVPEALGLGCYTIASDATCLADVALPAGVGEVVPAGQVAPLISALERARALSESRGIDHAAICRLAASFRWETFRHLIREACLGADGS